MLDKVSELMAGVGILHVVDRRPKQWEGHIYYGIYKSLGRARAYKCYFSYQAGVDWLTAVVPRKFTPEIIKERWHLEGKGDPTEFNSCRSRHYYPLSFPVIGGLINGKFTVEHKKDFFTYMASLR